MQFQALERRQYVSITQVIYHSLVSLMGDNRIKTYSFATLAKPERGINFAYVKKPLVHLFSEVPGYVVSAATSPNDCI